MPFNLNLEKASPTTVAVALEPARNVLASMTLLTKEEELPGLSNWILEKHKELTPEQRFRHTLVVIGFYYIVAADEESATFEQHLAWLKNMDPQAMRQRLLDAYSNIGAKHGKGTIVNWNSILASAESYVQFLQDRFGAEWVDDAIETSAYEYLMDPPAMKELIVSHLQGVWDDMFKAEWTRVAPILIESVKAFQATDLTKMDRFEVARFVTGQDLDEEKWRPSLEKANRILFIPNAHIGPYVSRLPDENALIILFGARQPENAVVRIPDLDRADIIARLSALADETRLQILQMVRNNGEMRAQEIIEATKLSQPSVSRYLGQLTASGYLQEKRVNGAKTYVLNRERITKTLKAIEAFLLGQ